MITADDVPTPSARTLPTGNAAKVSRFLAACLAPLSAGEQAAASKAFLRQLDQDKMLAWDAAAEQLRYEQALHTAAAIRSLQGGACNADQLACYEAWLQVKAAKRALCQVPAPTARELKFKLRHLAGEADDVGKRQIEADRQRFAAEKVA
jgi:hypothetical protein